MAGAERLELPKPRFVETGALPIELRPYWY